MQETWVLSWEEEMVTHSSILAWKITRTEKPGRLESMGLQRVGQDLATENSHKQIQQQSRLNIEDKCENVSYISFCVTQICEMDEKWQHSQESKATVIQKEMSKGINTLLINMSKGERETLWKLPRCQSYLFLFKIN